jgi:hypothetical protein
VILLVCIKGVQQGENLFERALAVAFALVTLAALIAVAAAIVGICRFGAALIR